MSSSKSTTRPSAKPAAYIGWFAVAASAIVSCVGIARGGEAMITLLLDSTALGGLFALVAGAITLCGWRRMQGALLIAAAVILLACGAAVLFVLAAAAVRVTY
ncbi:hypothetical protein ACS7SF_27535 (plasmid) [Ralstonia sp. 25C]|uniref:hypothetical protein n=1 Tax=Ralstonia sp. 25C TaxID=3447363 RepID=UPI003F7518BD